MSETFFRTETARADTKNTLLFFLGGVLIVFLLLYDVGENFRGNIRGGGKKLIRQLCKN